MRAKILIQSAWLRKLDWDTPLPVADIQSWKLLLDELPLLNTLRINRWLGSDGSKSRIELHGFADASERGYAAVLYLRSTTNNRTTLHILAAKGKVAPVKPVSLPRLELCAATLLTNITSHTRSLLGLSTASIYLWSDSQVTLHWIRGHASRWKTYVANRVSHIQLQLPEAHWRHVPGRDNPVDCASRGILPSELVGYSLWWTGPAWLRKDDALWPDDGCNVPDVELPERRAVGSLSAVGRVIIEPEMLLRFPSLHRLLKVTAWCLRWRCRAPSSRTHHSTIIAPSLEPQEMDAALIRWIRKVQSQHYQTEVSSLNKDRTMPPRSPLIGLSPFLDDNGVLRVGGRLKHAILSQDERHHDDRTTRGLDC